MFPTTGLVSLQYQFWNLKTFNRQIIVSLQRFHLIAADIPFLNCGHGLSDRVQTYHAIIWSVIVACHAVIHTGLDEQ